MKFFSSLLLLFEAFTLLTFKGFPFAIASDVNPQNLEEIPFLHDDSGFYIKANVVFTDSPKEIRMTLGLTHSQIIFPEYNSCEIWMIAKNESKFAQLGNPPSEADLPVKIENPSFSAKGMTINRTVEIGSTHWNQRKEILIAHNCTSDSQYTGKLRAGILGLGTEGPSFGSFSKVFAIDINTSLQQGKLLFYFSKALAGSIPPVVFSADSNWQIFFNKGNLTIGNKTFPLSGRVIFNPHVDDIVLPLNVWRSMEEQLFYESSPCIQGNKKIRCPAGTKISGPKFNSLSLFIGDKLLKLPPRNVEGLSVDKGIDFVSSGASTQEANQYVRPLYRDAIILGAKFMSYYHILFKNDKGANTIELYSKGDPEISKEMTPAKKSEESKQGNEKVNASGMNAEKIGYGVVGLVVIALLCCLFGKKKRSPKPYLPNPDLEISMQGYKPLVQERLFSGQPPRQKA